jgi:hypothetical protein
MINSEPAGKDNAQLRFLKSCVVELPRTRNVSTFFSHEKKEGLPMLSLEALMYLAAAAYPAEYRDVDFLPMA